MTSRKEDFLPITIGAVHDAELSSLIIEGVMTKDFGPWKKDENRILTFDFEKGEITEQDGLGEILARVSIQIQPTYE